MVTKSVCLKLIVAGVLLAASLLMPVAGLAQVASEYDIKAAFLYGFIRFVEWPVEDPQERATFIIAILGTDPFGRAIDDAVKGKSVRGRKIAIKRWGSVKDLGRCDLLFVSSSEAGNMEPIQKALGKSPVLTVSDHPDFILHGGIINFVNEEGRVRFDISPEVARRSGLVIGSGLLSLARTAK